MPIPRHRVGDCEFGNRRDRTVDLVSDGLRVQYGGEWGACGGALEMRTKAPTVMPAATDGTELVRM